MFFGLDSERRLRYNKNMMTTKQFENQIGKTTFQSACRLEVNERDVLFVTSLKKDPTDSVLVFPVSKTTLKNVLSLFREAKEEIREDFSDFFIPYEEGYELPYTLDDVSDRCISVVFYHSMPDIRMILGFTNIWDPKTNHVKLVDSITFVIEATGERIWVNLFDNCEEVLQNLGVL